MMPMGEYDVIAEAYTDVHKSKVENDQRTLKVNHTAYLERHRLDNSNLFVTMSNDLDGVRKEFAKKVGREISAW